MPIPILDLLSPSSRPLSRSQSILCDCSLSRLIISSLDNSRASRSRGSPEAPGGGPQAPTPIPGGPGSRGRKEAIAGEGWDEGGPCTGGGTRRWVDGGPDPEPAATVELPGGGGWYIEEGSEYDDKGGEWEAGGRGGRGVCNGPGGAEMATGVG